MTSVRRLSIDGAYVDITGEGIDLSYPPTTSVRVIANRKVFEFTASTQRESAAGFAKAATGIELTERLTYQGGELRTGTGPDFGVSDVPVTRIGVWEGMHTSLYTNVSNMSVAELIALFDVGRITERPEGLTYEVAQTGGVAIERGPSLVQGIPGVGILGTRRMDASLENGIPKHQGTVVDGGEMFVERDAQQTVLYIVNKNCVARFLVDKQANEAYVVEQASHVQVTWN
jgi:hypothetical protein